jgi:hypothetical protein
LAFLVVLAAVVIIAVMALTGGGSDPNEPEIAGIPCESGERLEYHVHARLQVIIEGQPAPIPANIGVKPGECIYWLHTHTDDGLIHVEAPSEAEYTLGQFFAIWGEPLSSTQILDKTTDAEHTMRVTVNGSLFDGDPTQITLTDQKLIVIEYGPPFAAG